MWSVLTFDGQEISKKKNLWQADHFVPLIPKVNLRRPKTVQYEKKITAPAKRLSKRIITATGSDDSDNLPNIMKSKTTSAGLLSKEIITVTSSDDLDSLPDITKSKAASASPLRKKLLLSQAATIWIVLLI